MCWPSTHKAKMLIVALGIVVAANAISVVLLAAMWTARASRRHQQGDLPEVAGSRLVLAHPDKHKATGQQQHTELFSRRIQWSVACPLKRMPVAAGLLKGYAGAKGADWVRARSVLAAQHSRHLRPHRVSWSPQSARNGGSPQVRKPLLPRPSRQLLNEGCS